MRPHAPRSRALCGAAAAPALAALLRSYIAVLSSQLTVNSINLNINSINDLLSKTVGVFEADVAVWKKNYNLKQLAGLPWSTLEVCVLSFFHLVEPSLASR